MGETQRTTCPACSSENPAGYRRCWACGQSLDEPARPAQSSMLFKNMPIVAVVVIVGFWLGLVATILIAAF